jgi:rhodanese-related sulfurtransferase
MLRSGATLVDVRPITDFGAGHLPKSLSIALRDGFGTWLGWVAPPDQPIIILRGPDQDPEEIIWQAAKVGYDNVVAELDGGIAAWRAAGFPVNTTQLDRRVTRASRSLIDIRQASEFAAGHVPGATNLELGELSDTVDRLPPGPVAVMCGHGERAMTAASLLERVGRDEVVTILGGPQDWADHQESALETGR